MKESLQTQKEEFLNEATDDEAYKTVNPAPESVDSDTLRPQHALDNKVTTMVGREGDYPKYEASAQYEMEKEKIRYNAMVDRLYLLSRNCHDESRPVAERRVWADAFTEQSIAIYGQPDPDVAKIIDLGGGEQIIERYKPTLDAVRNWLIDKYGDVFSALDLDGKTEKLSPGEIVEVFNNGLNALKTSDARWDGWKVEMKPDAIVLSCESADKTIFVGANREPITPIDLKGFFAHEVLRHAMTAVNGEDLGVTSALPRYISAEEGFAVIYQVAISGGNNLKKTMDRYSDMAFALGQLDGQKHTRSEVVSRKLERKRAAGKTVGEKDERIATRSANQIFRGTPGNDEISGVFTKGVSYFGGFVPCVEFIKQGLESGKDINQIMMFANAAKFDPNDPVQQEYIQSKIVDRYLPKLPLALPQAPEVLE